MTQERKEPGDELVGFENRVRARVNRMSAQELRLLLLYLIESGSTETLMDIDTASKRPEFSASTSE
jgi:hypothetical protein